MEKILFIVPPHNTFDAFINPAPNERAVKKKDKYYGSFLTEMPLGVLSLSAYVKKRAGAETKLLDFNIVLNKLDSFKFGSFCEFFRDYLSDQRWLAYAPDIIGISALFTPAYRSMLDIAECCREKFPKAIIIAGGGVPTNMYSEIFRDSASFDAVCFGEGEKPLLGLLKAPDKIKFFDESLAWVTRRKVNDGAAFQHDFVENLDDIPFYDYDICEIEQYGLNPAITAYASVREKKQNFYLMTSRGCPHHCVFCSSHTVHGRAMRYHSVERVRQDLLRLKNQYGAKIIIFQDDHFLADKRRAMEIIKLVKELRLNVVFQNGLALYALDRKTLETLKEAGVDHLMLSIESGSDRVLKEVMHKPLNTAIARRVADDCRELGIYTNANILIGLPGETKQDIEDARAFLKTLNANWLMVFCASPLIGSEMHEICLKKNYLKNGFLENDYKKAGVETEDFTAEYIQETAYIMNLEFNFVFNNDFRLGNYEVALKGFENAIKAKDDHAIAYYYAAKCYEKIGNPAKAREYLDLAKKITRENEFWRKYAKRFNLPL